MRKLHDEFYHNWNQLYKVLSKYPEHFSEASIGMNAFQWVYVLLTNRCFASPWYMNS